MPSHRSTYYFTRLGWKDDDGAGAQNIGNAGVRAAENKVVDRWIVEREVKKGIPEMEQSGRDS